MTITPIPAVASYRGGRSMCRILVDEEVGEAVIVVGNRPRAMTFSGGFHLSPRQVAELVLERCDRYDSRGPTDMMSNEDFERAVSDAEFCLSAADRAWKGYAATWEGASPSEECFRAALRGELFTYISTVDHFAGEVGFTEAITRLDEALTELSYDEGVSGRRYELALKEARMMVALDPSRPQPVGEVFDDARARTIIMSDARLLMALNNARLNHLHESKVSDASLCRSVLLEHGHKLPMRPRLPVAVTPCSAAFAETVAKAIMVPLPITAGAALPVEWAEVVAERKRQGSEDQLAATHLFTLAAQLAAHSGGASLAEWIEASAVDANPRADWKLLLSFADVNPHGFVLSNARLKPAPVVAEKASAADVISAPDLPASGAGASRQGLRL